MTNTRCNCENGTCEDAGIHAPGGCDSPAGKRRMMYVGKCCDECAKKMPDEYMLPEGTGMLGPRKPMKHHLKPKHLIERSDEDVDQINPEDIHPDAAGFHPDAIVEENERSFGDEEHELHENGKINPRDGFFNQKRNANTISVSALRKLAEILENPDNETLIAVENDSEALATVAATFMKAADALREVADLTSAFEPAPEAMTEQKLEEMAAVAEAFAESDDPLLQKQAAVLDDILFSLASPQNAFLFSNAAEDNDDRIEQLKKKYNETRDKQQKWNHIAEAVKDIEKSPVYKEYRVMEEPLSTRYCPDHAGVSTHRVGEHTVRCALDGKTYNWDEGFITQKGNKVPGSTVQEQNSSDQHNTFTTFDSRSTRMGYNPGE